MKGVFTMKRKTYMFISIALLITIFLSFLIVNAYAEDIDLSNLNLFYQRILVLELVNLENYLFMNIQSMGINKL